MRDLRKRLEKLEEKLRPNQSLVEPVDSEPPVVELENGERVELSREDRRKLQDAITVLELRAGVCFGEQQKMGIPDPPPLTEEERKRRSKELIDTIDKMVAKLIENSKKINEER